MKERKNKLISWKAFSLLLTAMLLMVGSVRSQEAEKAAEPEAVAPSFDFTSIQHSDNTITLKATLKAKIDGTLTKLSGKKLVFFSTSDSAEQKLGEAVTDRNGTAALKLSADGLVANAEGKLNFKVTFEGGKNLEAAEEVVAFKRGRLVITPVKEDSTLTIQAKLVDLSTGAETPIAETNVAVYVKRLFNPLKVGEGATDEAGEVAVTVPNNLPGDSKGLLSLIAKVEDNENFGNMEAVSTQKWGVPVTDKVSSFPRALWSPNPPIWMLVTFIILMTTVWGHYIVIVYELFRLRKEEPHVNKETQLVN
jgi:hypothetical protein